MTDKAIFITGGASGIGLATADLFAARGWFVGLADVDEAGLARAADRIGARCSTHRMDVRDRAQWAEALAGFAERSGGRLDVLFNNAGIARGGPFEALPPEDSDLLIDINFRGVVNGAYAALPYLTATPGSCLLNTCSAAGLYGSPRLAVYAATKFAVRGLSEALDIEWRPHGVRVRSIMPSFIDTPLLSVAIPGSNQTARDKVVEAGLEFTPVETVAEAAWAAAHGERVHTLVGKTARRIAFGARWMPGRLRKMLAETRGGQA